MVFIKRFRVVTSFLVVKRLSITGVITASQVRPLKMTTHSSSCWPVRKRWIWSVLAFFVICGELLPFSSRAGEVYGHIYTNAQGQRQLLPNGETFSVIVEGNRIPISLGKGGSYRLVLAPGTYAVTYCDMNRQKWGSQIHSLHGPVLQNIQLERENGTCER
jgi:hypothetical protein